jgi:hypothetical protein
MNKSQISLLAALLDAHVDYAVVGGVAVNAYGYLRATNDLDIFIRPTEENAQAAFAALAALGVPLEGFDATDLLNDEETFVSAPSTITSTSLPPSAKCPSTKSGKTGLRHRYKASP